jgi:hypothetical protein
MSYHFEYITLQWSNGGALRSNPVSLNRMNRRNPNGPVLRLMVSSTLAGLPGTGRSTDLFGSIYSPVRFRIMPPDGIGHAVVLEFIWECQHGFIQSREDKTCVPINCQKAAPASTR